MGMLETNSHPRRTSRSKRVSEDRVLTVVSAGSRTLKVSRSTQVRRFNRRIQTEPEVSVTSLATAPLARPRDHEEMAVQTSARSVSHSFATANMASTSSCTFSIFNKSQLSSDSDHKPPVGRASRSSTRLRQELSSLSLSQKLPVISDTDFLPFDSLTRPRRPSLTCSSVSGSFQDLLDTVQHFTSPCSLLTSDEISLKVGVQVSTQKPLVSQHHLHHHHYHHLLAQQQQQSSNSNTISQYLEALDDRYFSPITQRFLPGARPARKTVPKPSNEEAFVLSRQPGVADVSSQSSLAIPVPPQILSSSSTSSTAPADMPSSSVDFQPPVYFSYLPVFTEPVSSVADSPTYSTGTTLVSAKPPYIAPSASSKDFFSQYRGKKRRDQRRGFKTLLLRRTLSNQSSSSIYTKLKSPSSPNSDEMVITVGRDSVGNTSLVSLSNQLEPPTPVNDNRVDERSPSEQLELVEKESPDTADFWQQSSSVMKENHSEEILIYRLQNNLISVLTKQNKSTQTTSSISLSRRESSPNKDNSKNVSALNQSRKKSIQQEKYSKTASQPESSSLKEKRLQQGAVPTPEVRKQSSWNKTRPSKAELERDALSATTDTQPEDVIISFEYRNLSNDAQPNNHTKQNPQTQSQKTLKKLEMSSPEESKNSEELIISVSSYDIQSSPNQRHTEALHKPNTFPPKKERHSDEIFITVSDNIVQKSLHQKSQEIDSKDTAARSAHEVATGVVARSAQDATTEAAAHSTQGTTLEDVESPLPDNNDQSSVNKRKSFKLSYNSQPSSKNRKASDYLSSPVSDKNEQSQRRSSSSSVKRQSLSTEDNVVEDSSIPVSQDNDQNSVTHVPSIKLSGVNQQPSTKDRRSEHIEVAHFENTGREPLTQKNPSNAVSMRGSRLSPIQDQYTEEMILSRGKDDVIYDKLTSPRETRHIGSQTPLYSDYSSSPQKESGSMDYVGSVDASQHPSWLSADKTLLSNKGAGKSTSIESKSLNDKSKGSIRSKEKPTQITRSFRSDVRSPSLRKGSGIVQPGNSTFDKDTSASPEKTRSPPNTGLEARQIPQVQTTAIREKTIAIKFKNLTHLVISRDRSATGSPIRTSNYCDGKLMQSKVNFVDSLTDDGNPPNLARTSGKNRQFQTTYELAYPKASPLTMGSLPRRPAFHPGTSHSLNVELISRHCQTDPVSILPSSPVFVNRHNLEDSGTSDQKKEFNQFSTRSPGPISRVFIENNSKPPKHQQYLGFGTQGTLRYADSEPQFRKHGSHVSQQSLTPRTKSSTCSNAVRLTEDQHQILVDTTATSHRPSQSSSRHIDPSLQFQQKSSPAQPKSMYLLDYSQTNPRGLQNSSNSPTSGPRPQTVICYLCGRQYGTASIGLHEKRCLAQLLQYNQPLPPHLQRPVPNKPNIKLDAVREIHGSQTGTYDLDSINHASFAALTTQYVPCLKCKRTFIPESLEVHARCCRGQFKRRGTPVD